MISLSGDSLALLSAAFARVEKNKNHTFPKNESGLEEITRAIGAESYSVYDLGRPDNRTRYLRFVFPTEDIEFEIGPQPELIKPDNLPEGDGPPPGTPIELAMAA